MCTECTGSPDAASWLRGKFHGTRCWTKQPAGAIRHPRTRSTRAPAEHGASSPAPPRHRDSRADRYRAARDAPDRPARRRRDRRAADGVSASGRVLRGHPRARRRWRGVTDRARGEGGEHRDQPDPGVHAVRSDRGGATPRDRVDLRRRPRTVHAADRGHPPARARARDVLRGRDRGAVLQRLDDRDRRLRRRDWRPHRGARSDVEAHRGGAALAAARAGQRDRALRGELPPPVPAARTGSGTRPRSRSCTATGC